METPLGSRFYWRGKHHTLVDTRTRDGEFQICLVPDSWAKKKPHWTHWIAWRLFKYRLKDGGAIQTK